MAQYSISHPAERQLIRGIGKEKNRRPTFEQIKETQKQLKLKKKRNRGK